jgi:AMP-polyphosphate phosphotransferase
VLVERVEGFATRAEWMRAFQEINEFEEQLAGHGAILAKFWLHLSKEEQYRRFKDREEKPWKQHKITDDDWRNREKWDDYREAVNEMVQRTGTEYAPWHLVPSEDKRYARVFVLKTLCEAIKNALELA